MVGIPALIPTDGIHLDAQLVQVDMTVMAAIALVCIPVFLTGKRVARWEGAAFVAAYLVYLGYLLMTRVDGPRRGSDGRRRAGLGRVKGGLGRH